MRYQSLADSDLKVSSICLGTMTWGEQNTEVEAHAQLDFSLDYGVNFIDTAELYPVPPKKETYACTESYIGNWLRTKKNRSKIILGTKISGRAPHMRWIRGGTSCFDRANIHKALEESLRRLRTDYIDLYYLHWPDRKTNFFGQLGYQPAKKDDAISIEETLYVLDEIVKAGKIRYIALSNETPWGVMEYLKISEKKMYPKIIGIQNPYNLLNRSYEIGLAEISHRENIGLLAYSPLAFGSLTGKYLTDNVDNTSRLKIFGKHFQRYSNLKAQKIIIKYVKIAKKYNLSPAQMSLAFVNKQPFVRSNIIGATNLSQLEENITSINIKLTKEISQEIEKIHFKNPNPCP